MILLAVELGHAHSGQFGLVYPMNSISIDGDLSDWPDSLPIYPLGAFHFNTPESQSDFHGRFRIRLQHH